MSPRRALTLLAASGLLVACGDDAPAGPDPSTSPVLTTLTITPGADTARSLEQEVPFSAEARDQEGRTMSDVELTWEVTDGDVADITAGGTATSRANGVTAVIVSAEGEADTASLLVAQEAASVTVSPDTVMLEAAGDTARFTAEARDANDVLVEEAGLAWSTTHQGVATIDADGLATAEAEGAVSVVATADADPSGKALLVIGEMGPPVTGSVDPSPLREGEAATITGEDFVADPAENTVTVGGVEATVSAATPTRLEITVPAYDCLPARDVEVAVATFVAADTSAAALEPDEAPLALAAGEQTLVRDPSAFCLQFAETTASERYLVGVQSLSDAVGGLTDVTITSEAAGGDAASLEASVSLAPERPRLRGGGREIRTDPRRDAHRRAEQALRSWERRHLDPAASLPARPSAGPPLLRAVSGGASVGDTVPMRVADLGGTNACTQYFEIGAEVRALGTRAIVVADTANPDGGFTDADYQDLSDRIDDDIFSTQVDYFGEPTDLDANGRVVVVVSRAVNEGHDKVLGFVFAGDLFPRSECASSDEGEVFYARAPDPDGEHGPAYATETARELMPFIMAHELSHVIQMARRFSDGNDFMSPIVAEGQATLSEEVVGHHVTGRRPGQNYGYTVAFNSDDSDEVDWYRNAFQDLSRYYGFESSTTRVEEAPDRCGWWWGDPSPCVARSLWYGVSWSFLRWVSDRHGPAYPGGEQGLHQDIIGNDLTGPANVADVVGVPLEELMARWSAALYVDDRIASPDPALTLPSWDLVDIESSVAETARLQPVEMGFTDWNADGEVRASSAGYLSLDGDGRPATAVRVRGPQDGTLFDHMRVWVVRLR